MNVRERLLEAARTLAAARPLDRLSLAEIARTAGVSWPTARRHLGSKERLRALLAEESAGQAEAGTRSRLLTAAARVFARHGYAEATLDEVAEEAGLTKGAVYWHFASKSDLYLALLQERVQQEAAALPAAIGEAAENADPLAGLAGLLARQFAVAYAEPERPRLSLEFMSRTWDPEVRRRLGDLYFAAHQRLAEILGTVQSSGLMAGDLDPLLVSVFLSAVIEGLVRYWLMDPDRIDPKAWAPQLARIIFKGVGA
ncbi:MAG: TetR family transcriptional regulator [Chitinophagales bacterium]